MLLKLFLFDTLCIIRSQITLLFLGSYIGIPAFIPMDNPAPFCFPPSLSQAEFDAGVCHQFLSVLYSTHCVMFPEEHWGGTEFSDAGQSRQGCRAAATYNTIDTAFLSFCLK
jgi:hypothetical protein